jgi:hypothetical protein
MSSSNTTGAFGSIACVVWLRAPYFFGHRFSRIHAAARRSPPVISIDVNVLPAPRPPLTEARLDSAFGHVAVGVFTDGSGPGDTIVWTDLVEPEGRAIYFDHARLHLAIKGKAALAAFLAFNPDSVTLRWCTEAGKDTSLVTALLRPSMPSGT